jgi:hypothetical protein
LIGLQEWGGNLMDMVDMVDVVDVVDVVDGLADVRGG